MNNFNLFFSQTRAHRHHLLISLVMLLTACSSVLRPEPSPLPATVPGIVVLGVVAKSGLKAPIDASRMSTDLAALLAGKGGVQITPFPVVREIIGAGPHDEMMAFYARHGRLAPYQVQRMMAANLPSSKALTVRLESDQIEHLPVERQNVVNADGMLIADRERRIYTTRRTTQLSATLLNLRNGRVVWTRQYRVSPETLLAANHHTGGNFSSSLAAAVANTMVRGLTEQQHPKPPHLTDSVLALLQEVAYNVPVE